MLLPPPTATPPRVLSARRAFTLVEMLVVMAVIILLIGITTPVITSLGRAGDINKAVYDIAGVLEQSRAYALSNNTYVYVGFLESSITTSESAQQTATPAAQPGGRVAVAVVASKDGSSSIAAGALPEGNLAAINKVQTFSNLHLADLTANTGKTPQTGAMSRPPFNSNDSLDPKYNLGCDACVSATAFGYPLNSTAGLAKYSFKKIIQYDPQGVARIQQSVGDDTIVKQFEVGLQQSRGNSAPAFTATATSGSIAALQVDGMTGSTHIYRP